MAFPKVALATISMLVSYYFMHPLSSALVKKYFGCSQCTSTGLYYAISGITFAAVSIALYLLLKDLFSLRNGSGRSSA